MVDRKKTRAGLTHEAQRANPEAWFRIASSFRAAAEVLEEFADRIPSDSRPFALNAAVSLELIFKAILAKQKQRIPDGSDGHDLMVLCEQAGVAISEEQRLTLDLMTQELIWVARYPTPKRPEAYDRFHNETFQKHEIREVSGNVYSVRANPATFSNFKNYEKIWIVAVGAFNKLSS